MIVVGHGELKAKMVLDDLITDIKSRWFDADTVIMNPNIPLSIFLPPPTSFSHVHILVTNDFNGLNNGVFPIRVSAVSVELMSAVVSFRTYKPDTRLQFRDQSALDMTLKTPRFRKNAVYLPQRWFNSYQGELNETIAPFQIRRGDFLVHFAGVGNRDIRMGVWMDRAEQHLPEWEIDLVHTSYPSEAKEFWRQKEVEIEVERQKVIQLKGDVEKLVKETEEGMKEFAGQVAPPLKKTVEETIQKIHVVLDKNVDEVDMEKVEQTTNTLKEVRYLLHFTLTWAFNVVFLNA